MKIAIGVLFVIGAIFIVVAWIGDRHSANRPDDYSWIVPAALGGIILLVDFALLAAYALWRLFT